MTLTIVYQKGTLVDYWHLREALLWVHQSVDECSHHTGTEEGDDSIVLIHVLWVFGCGLLTRSAHHSYK